MGSEKKIVAIVNEKHLKSFLHFLKNAPFKFSCFVCKTRSEAILKASHIEANTLLLAGGGDGTVNAIVNGLFQLREEHRKSIAVALMPLGTGRDYFSNVFYQKQTSWLQTVVDNERLSVDVGVIHSKENPVYFINSCSVGISPEVLKFKEKLCLPSTLKYLVATLLSLCVFKPKVLSFKVQNQVFEEKLLVGLFLKGRFAAGGMKLGGFASLRDGNLDIKLVPTVSLLKIMKYFHKLYQGNLEQVPFVKSFLAHELQILSEGTIELELDGDVKAFENVYLKLVPQSLNLCYPRI